MEYLEGETLADRLLKGALPLDQALKVGAEICDGLEKAHCSGVVHRDLKPSNIMLTKTGAKLMDFGLAKPAVAATRSGRKIMAVEIATKPGFTAGKPRVLFEGEYLPTPGTFPNYDVSPDGQRFLMIKPNDAGDAAPAQINVVLNWFEELKRLAPTGKK
jgi:serine/threonine protein kinase